MSENFGLKIGLEGEREFKKSLAEINNSFKVLGSEMKLVDSQFDKNDKSAEALTARNQVLNKEIEQQKQKIETLRTALQNAAESFGENDRRTQSWQIQLNNAQAALNGMERELNSNNTALEKADKGFDEAGDEAKDFSDSVKKAADTSEDARKQDVCAVAPKGGTDAANRGQHGKAEQTRRYRKENRRGSRGCRRCSRNSLRCRREKAVGHGE